MKKVLNALTTYWASRKLGEKLGFYWTLIVFLLIFWIVGWLS